MPAGDREITEAMQLAGYKAFGRLATRCRASGRRGGANMPRTSTRRWTARRLAEQPAPAGTGGADRVEWPDLADWLEAPPPSPEPPAAAAPVGPSAFALDQRVEKVKGSSWRGRVVGTYSTSLTPRGYAVESEREPGSVQIYPEAALRAVLDADSSEEGR